MEKEPKPRKIRHRTHKNFGSHSRIIDELAVRSGTAGGRHVGDKQIAPGDYGSLAMGGSGDHRSKEELLNDAEINHTD